MMNAITPQPHHTFFLYPLLDVDVLSHREVRTYHKASVLSANLFRGIGGKHIKRNFDVQ